MNVLKVVRVKGKAALYLLYRVVDEFNFENIARTKSLEETCDILEKAYKRGD